MKIGAFIVARLSSSRLKKKNLLPLLDRTMIEHLVERTKKANCLDFVGIATSTDQSDDELEVFARKMSIPCFRGSLEHVMERIAAAGKHFECDYIVEILGDNPLVHSQLIDDVVGLCLKEKLDYASNITNEYGTICKELKRFPIGVRVQAYTTKVASEWKQYPEFFKKDIGTSAYIFNQTEIYRCGYVDASGPWQVLNEPSWHFAVNYQKNFDLIENIFNNLYPQDANFSLQQVIQYIKKHNELLKWMGEPSPL